MNSIGYFVALSIGALAVLPPFHRVAASDVDVLALFADAEAAGKVGIASKIKAVDGRPARPGEMIVTVIKGEGEETRSKPAEAGDWVVRNRCPQTGNEQYLVRASKFPQLYTQSSTQPDADGWRELKPVGQEVLFFVASDKQGPFTFTAPWGEPMAARPGDAIVQNPRNKADTYRVAAKSFTCTYQVIKAP